MLNNSLLGTAISEVLKRKDSKIMMAVTRLTNIVPLNDVQNSHVLTLTVLTL